MNEMINQIIALRGTEVEEFGQPKLMPKESEFDPLLIDVVDVLSELEQYEVHDFVGFTPNQEELFFDELEDYLYYVYENHGQHSVLRGNTFNHSAPISNHIDFDVFEFEDGFMGDKVFVEMKCHLGFGDVRAHYTDSVLLEFENIDHFYQAFFDAGYKMTVVEVGEREIEVSSGITDGSHEVFSDGHYLMTYEGDPDLEELKYEVSEQLGVSIKRENEKELEM